MKLKLAAIFLIACFAGFARAQAPPPPDAGSDAMMDSDSSDIDPTTEPVADEQPTPSVQTTGVPTTQTTAQPTTRPRRRHYRRPTVRTAQSPSIAPTPQPKKMSADFDVVMNRSIFLKGSQTTTGTEGGFAPPTGSAAAPEHSLVFNGVARG